MKEISQKIFNLLIEQGKTQKQLSEFIGIKQTAISQWKKDGTNPKAEFLPIITRFFNISADYLLGLTDSPAAIDAPEGWGDLSEPQQKEVNAMIRRLLGKTDAEQKEKTAKNGGK